MLTEQRLQQISAEGLKSWSRCKRQFYYKHIKKLRWPSDICHFQLGKDVHKLLDYQARGLNCNLLLQSAPQNVRLTWQKLYPHPLVHTPVIASEWAFHTPVSAKNGIKAWLTGRIDRISRLDNGKIAVIDWKTGTGIPKDPESDWQTRLYLFAVIEVGQAQQEKIFPGKPLLKIEPEQLQFIYVQAKADTSSPIREVTIDYTPSKHEATRQTLQQITATMAEEEDYEIPENRQCPDKYCAYQSICGILEPH